MLRSVEPRSSRLSAESAAAGAAAVTAAAAVAATGNLRANNLVDVSQPLYKELRNPTTYAPYIEFGTGASVEIPSELQDEAMQFKGMGVRKVNMRAQPFFFWPYFMERSKLITRIKTLLS